jgi:hypothetical protein
VGVKLYGKNPAFVRPVLKRQEHFSECPMVASEEFLAQNYYYPLGSTTDQGLDIWAGFRLNQNKKRVREVVDFDHEVQVHSNLVTQMNASSCLLYKNQTALEVIKENQWDIGYPVYHANDTCLLGRIKFIGDDVIVKHNFKFVRHYNTMHYVIYDLSEGNPQASSQFPSKLCLGVPYNFNYEGQLNGNNGEATNTDDVDKDVSLKNSTVPSKLISNRDATTGQIPVYKSFLNYLQNLYPDVEATCNLVVGNIVVGHFPPVSVDVINHFLADYNIRARVGHGLLAVGLISLEFVLELTAGNTLHLDGLGLGGGKNRSKGQQKPNKEKKPKRKETTPPPKKSQRKKKLPFTGKFSVSKSTPASVQQYALARMHPFSDRSIGVKVPDPYPFPTTAFHVKTSLTIRSDNNGFLCGCVVPSPLFSFIDPGVSGIGSTSSCFGNSGGMYNFGQGLFCAVTQANFSSIANSFRTVCVGVTFRNMQAQLSAIGRLYVAVVPMSNEGYDPAILATVAFSSAGVQALMGNYGFPTVPCAAIQELPMSACFTVSDLLKMDFTISLPIYDQALYYGFKETKWNPVAATGINIGSQLTQGTGNLATNIGSSTITACGGGCGLIFFGDAFPANINAFDVDLIYHLENTPTITSTQSGNGGIIPITGNSAVPTIGTTQAVEVINNAVLEAGPFATTATATEFTNNTDSVTKSLSKGLDVMGTATKMAEAAAAFM